jgi:RND family efflux transporter MFP subunit
LIIFVIEPNFIQLKVRKLQYHATTLKQVYQSKLRSPEFREGQAMKKAVIITLVTLVGAAAGGWFFSRGPEAVTVQAIRVERGEITSTLSATGTVVSGQDAGISASQPGRVLSVDAREGDRVESGAVLAQLSDRELDERVKGAEASVREAKEKVRQLERDYAALGAVYAVGGTSRQSVDDARSSLAMARAAAGKAGAELNANRIALDKLKIRAPFAGIVTSRRIEPGEWAVPGATLFSLSKEGPRQIEVMVDESDAGLVKIGQSVELSSDAFPGRVWTEQVTRVAPAVEKQGGANSIKVRVSCGAQAPGLKLGQQVDAKIRTAHRAGIVKLPFDCLISSAGQTTVAVVEQGVIRFVPVVTGIEDAVSVEIVKGVSAGDTVVLPQGKPLKPGERVKAEIKDLSRP